MSLRCWRAPDGVYLATYTIVATSATRQVRSVWTMVQHARYNWRRATYVGKLRTLGQVEWIPREPVRAADLLRALLDEPLDACLARFGRRLPRWRRQLLPPHTRYLEWQSGVGPVQWSARVGSLYCIATLGGDARVARLRLNAYPLEAVVSWEDLSDAGLYIPSGMMTTSVTGDPEMMMSLWERFVTDPETVVATHLLI